MRHPLLADEYHMSLHHFCILYQVQPQNQMACLINRHLLLCLFDPLLVEHALLCCHIRTYSLRSQLLGCLPFTDVGPKRIQHSIQARTGLQSYVHALRVLIFPDRTHWINTEH